MSNGEQLNTEVIYELCVPSFNDSDADGLGDLTGIEQKLDYLQWLGITAIWLTPFYRTAFFDLGYDVIDHTSVDPRFGSLDDFDRLLLSAHRRDLKIILDFIPNHTSVEHPWFRESRLSKSHPKRDWYIWRDPRPNCDLPNNWTNQYEESAWTWDPSTEQFYFHSFHNNQVDLNWENPVVRSAMADVLTFWLDRGADGFRIDAMVHLAKDRLWRDNPSEEGKAVSDWPTWPMAHSFTQDQPQLLSFVAQICEVIHKYPGRLVIGENHLPIGRLPDYYRAGVTYPVNSQFLDVEWEASTIRRAIDNYEGLLSPEYCPTWVIGSHDNHRVGSRFKPDQIKPLAMLHLMLRGSPIIYFGEELGLPDTHLEQDELRDPMGRLLPGKGLGRDNQRTPMPWNSSPFGGFSETKPWLPLNSGYRSQNVAAQRDDPKSNLTLYRRLLELRGSSSALKSGDYIPIAQSEDAFCFLRHGDDAKFLIAINFADRPVRISAPEACGSICLTTQLDREKEKVAHDVDLRPNEGLVLNLTEND
jgi:alpha-glucosidase